MRTYFLCIDSHHAEITACSWNILRLPYLSMAYSVTDRHSNSSNFKTTHNRTHSVAAALQETRKFSVWAFGSLVLRWIPDRSSKIYAHFI
jgi:hypothetical protein